MTLKELLDGMAVRRVHGATNVAISDVTDDSRQVQPGALFVAVRGERSDGHRFVADAVKAGAAAVAVEDGASIPAPDAVSVPIVVLPDTRSGLGPLVSRIHRDPSAFLRLVGITGTNGKTTTAFLCKALLLHAGRSVGLIGTVAYEYGGTRLPAPHTTPGAVELQRLLARMRAAGVQAAVMEVSSHALALERTAGCEFDIGVFTNLTQDHLDFHKDLEDYFRAKLRLFTGLSTSGRKPGKRAIVNADDERGARIARETRVPVWTYALRGPADLRAEELRLSDRGTAFQAATPAGRFPVEGHLVGEHNVSNMLAAIGVALQEGLSVVQIQDGLAGVRNVPGRFERVEAGQDFTVVVDYAHTEDALVRLLSAAQALKRGRVLTVFGCGGDRDRGKRPKMGRAAAERSDVVILTSDNPRSEDPLAIIAQVEAGIRSVPEAQRAAYRVIPDRRQAIEAAVEQARPGDMVLIAGKGHEDYQIVGSVRHHFDDREVAREALLRRTRPAGAGR